MRCVSPPLPVALVRRYTSAPLAPLASDEWSRSAWARFQSQHRPVWAEVDLDRVASNLALYRTKAHLKQSQIMPVIKADAYGHGASMVAKLLVREGVRRVAVAMIDEGLPPPRPCLTLTQALPSVRMGFPPLVSIFSYLVSPPPGWRRPWWRTS